MRNPGSQGGLARELNEFVTQSLSTLLGDRLGVGADAWIDVSELTEACAALADSERPIIRYLSHGAMPSTAPIYSILATTPKGPSPWPLSLPRRTTARRVAGRLMQESQWVAGERIHD
jgi:hypothetical protein